MSGANTVTLTSTGDLTIADIEAVAHGRANVALADEARSRVAAFRAAAEAALKRPENKDKRFYGVNTGFGSNFSGKPDDLKRLQRNLILSHCAGMGPAAPKEVVRATMLLRAASLARARSVVRVDVIDKLIEMLNNGVTPAVPSNGSVSASGDLAPLSHIAAVMIGEGRVLAEDGSSVPTAELIAKGRFSKLELQFKEGLALNNGCQWSNAWGALTAARMRRLIETAALTTALGVQVMRGMGRPFHKDLHDLRRHPGSVAVAEWVFDLLDGYEFQDVTGAVKNRYDGKIQDPYNLRCAAQVLGPCLDLIERAERTLEIEARSVTDNPIDLNDDPADYNLDRITSGGHFHGMPLAVDTYGLLQAAGIMARLSNLRCARIVDKDKNKGLGPQVRGGKPSSAESGLMIMEYTSAGLCNQIWGLAAPSHLMSLSTDSGQEDHVSMGANVAMRAYEASLRLADMLAIELAFSSQAEHLRAEQMRETPDAAAERDDVEAGRAFEAARTPVALGKRLGAALEEVRKTFPVIREDQELSWKMMNLAEKVLSGEIVRATGYEAFRH
jgi:histidine ammonia-lyase